MYASTSSRFTPYSTKGPWIIDNECTYRPVLSGADLPHREAVRVSERQDAVIVVGVGITGTKISVI